MAARCRCRAPSRRPKRCCSASASRTARSFRPDSWRCSTLKQLELAKALALRPRLLLLDEIAGGLTEAECDVLLDTIREVHRGGVTIVWIEHVIQALRRVVSSPRGALGGNFIAVGTPQDVLADRRVKEAYLGT